MVMLLGDNIGGGSMPVMLVVGRAFIDEEEIEPDDEFGKVYVFWNMSEFAVNDILSDVGFEFDGAENCWKIIAKDDMMYVVEVYDHVDEDIIDLDVRGRQKEMMIVLKALLEQIKEGAF